MATRTEYRYDVIPYSVYDGDTFRGEIIIDLGFGEYLHKKASFRTNGLDTPETKTQRKLPMTLRKKHRQAGLLVKAFAKELILDKNVVIETHKSTDKYGRVLGDLIIDYNGKKNVSYSEMMIQKGYAKPYHGGTKEKWTEKELDKIIKELGNGNDKTA